MTKIKAYMPNWAKNTTTSHKYLGSKAYSWSYSLKGVKSIIYTIKEQEDK